MRVFQINAVPYGSTGRIMFQLADALKAQGHQVLCTAGFTWKKCDREDFFITSNILEKTVHTHLARLTGRIGCFSYFATKRLLKRMDAFGPDVIHLHNLHGWFINLPLLFRYIKEKDIPVIWTLHDCWSFTGQCPYYDMVGCTRWQSECRDCSQFRRYPETYSDHARSMFHRKKSWFTGVKRMTVVTPSQWLADQVRQSFLREYPAAVINNGIDLQVFRPCESDVRARYGIGNRHMVLGVSYEWDARKGLDVFAALADRLGEEYRLVLVGTDEQVERQLPESVIAIRRTQDQHELAQLYAAADVFVNPTREENYPTVNMEALACGTPVITFATGGSPEILDESCGIMVPKDDEQALEAAIRRVCQERVFSRAGCLERAKAFDGARCIEGYMEFYERVTAKGI